MTVVGASACVASLRASSAGASVPVLSRSAGTDTVDQGKRVFADVAYISGRSACFAEGVCAGFAGFCYRVHIFSVVAHTLPGDWLLVVEADIAQPWVRARFA